MPYWLPIWGKALARQRPSCPSVPPGPGQRRLLGSAQREAPAHTDSDANFNFDPTGKTAGCWELSPARGSAAPGRGESAPKRATKTRLFG